MSKSSRSSIVGFHNLKNKVSRNAFDLSHRHMFTAQIGELLPVFVQWVNPNETFKIGYDGFCRTQPLQTAAFTRLKENIQYYFVPFQSLWKYFEQQVNNMTSGQSGENISRIAKSATEDTTITTGMPYLNYESLRTFLQLSVDALTTALVAKYNALSTGQRTYRVLMDWCNDNGYATNDVLNYASSCKLLRALGYLNTDMDTYDIVSSLIAYGSSQTSSITKQGFMQSSFGWVGGMNTFNVENAPNMSIFPLLAYNKIVNDHYIYRQWQAYKSYTCNIDYLSPNDSMNFASKLGNSPFNLDMFKMKYSNLPLDYFNGVLPKAQYGEESAVALGSGSLSTDTLTINSPELTMSNTPSATAANIVAAHDSTWNDDNRHAGLYIGSKSNATHVSTISGEVDLTSSSYASELKVSALRSAIALQKYKEIQESNDSDFASQVLAHYGIKPKHADYKSIFIGGGDNTISINPQVNQNLAGDNSADIKAYGTGQLSAHCKFHSDTFGIIIGIYRCVPQLDLAHVGIDRNNFKTDASDFPIPELDSIGMQTQYRCEVCAPKAVAKTSNYKSQTGLTLDMSKTYGYLPRFAELKTSYDRYEGAFLDSLSSWVTGYDSKVLNDWISSTTANNLLAYKDISTLLQCRPSICYPIFVDQSSACANNDKVLIGSVNTCVAVRPFSVYGLPYSK